jgi:leader peptidase (prepilin peptidase)/N-methyltransferase
MTAVTAAVRRRSLQPAAVSGAAAAVSATLAAVLLSLDLTPVYVATSAAVIVALAIAAAVVDARSRRLPNALVAPMGVLALVQAVALSLERGNPSILGAAVIAAVVLGILYAAMAFAGWVGVGDVKFIFVLGLFIGTFVGSAAIAIAPLAILLASAHRGFAAVLNRETSRRLPHGPTILIAAVAVASLVPLGLV